MTATGERMDAGWTTAADLASSHEWGTGVTGRMEEWGGRTTGADSSGRGVAVRPDGMGRMTYYV